MPRFASTKICLVTGGGSGLGRATAIDLASHGNTVVVGDVNDEAGLETVAAIEAAGGQALYRHLDVADRESVTSTVDDICRRFGSIDCAINNAGIEGPRARLADYPDDEWQRVIAINLTGVFNCMKAELTAMLRQEGGAIVNVGSTASLRGSGLMSAYVATKHALVGLTKTAALEYAAHNIRVNVLCPGGFRTPMSERINRGDFSSTAANTPMKRVAPAEEIAPAITWLCSDEASFITGAAHVVDGGRMAGAIVPD
jgi:NAD(P)-dependent dehydrogenase (short-subunit alcohol dehydrogenase family)